MVDNLNKLEYSRSCVEEVATQALFYPDDTKGAVAANTGFNSKDCRLVEGKKYTFLCSSIGVFSSRHLHRGFHKIVSTAFFLSLKKMELFFSIRELPL